MGYERKGCMEVSTQINQEQSPGAPSPLVNLVSGARQLSAVTDLLEVLSNSNDRGLTSYGNQWTSKWSDAPHWSISQSVHLDVQYLLSHFSYYHPHCYFVAFFHLKCLNVERSGDLSLTKYLIRLTKGCLSGSGHEQGHDWLVSLVLLKVSAP